MPMTSKKASTTEDKLLEDTFVNKFDELEVQNEIDDTSISGTMGSVPPTSTTEYTVDLSANKNEAVLAAMYLFMDLHTIRVTVRELWRAYSERSLDLAAVSIATNTAIDFVRSLHQDYETNFGEVFGLDNVSCLYCFSLRDTGHPNTPIDHTNERCLAIPHQILSGYLEDLIEDPSDYVPLVAPSHIGLYDTKLDRSQLAAVKRLEQDFKVAMGVIPEIGVLIKEPKVRWQAEHELIRGLRELRTSQKTVFWASFALQVHLDIRHILRENVSRCFDELCLGTGYVSDGINKILNFHNKPGEMPHEKSLREVLELSSRWTKTDVIGRFRQDLQLDPTTPSHMSEYYLLKRDPLWCGLLLYNFRVVAYEGAIIAANMCLSVTTAVHLYNCLKTENVLEIDWKDMETVLSTHAMDGILIGGRDKSPDYSKCFALAIGVSPVMLALDSRKSRSKKTKLSLEKSKRLQTRTPVHSMFKHRCCDSGGRVDFNPSAVEKKLRESQKTVIDPLIINSQPKADLRALVVELASAIHRETLEVTFDYFGMHIICWKLLCRFSCEIGPAICGRSDEEDIFRNTFLLLSRAAASQSQMHMEALRKTGELFGSVLGQEGHAMTVKQKVAIVDMILARSGRSLKFDLRKT